VRRFGLYFQNYSVGLGLFVHSSRYYWCNYESEFADFQFRSRLRFGYESRGINIEMTLTFLIVVTAALILSGASWHRWE